MKTTNKQNDKAMRIEDFTKTCNYLKKSRFKFDNPDNWGDNNKLLDYCRSVYPECKATMNDKDLEVMLGEYYDCLIYDETADEIEDLLRTQEEVCRRLAEKSFRQYGRKWAESLERLVDNGDPASLNIYEKCIGIYDRLVSEYRKDDDYERLLAECYYRTARFCDLHHMHWETIGYTDKLLELYWKFYRHGEDNVVEIGNAYQQKGESYISLEMYEEAKEWLLKAIDLFSRFKGGKGTWRSMNVYGPSIDFCRRYLEKIQRLESIPEAK